MPELSFEPLTPTAFLDRAAYVYPDRVAVVDGVRSFRYAELAARSSRLAGALAGLGVQPGDRVAVLAPNSALLLEAHFGVPQAGAVLVALNIRLSPVELAYIVDHSRARVLLCDSTLADTARAVAGRCRTPPTLVESANRTDDRYEALLSTARPLVVPVTDERSLLALNYTSGTTGQPKGVEYHHRGAYLQGLALAYHSELRGDSVFLWTLPMFHCNGWCFPWAVTAAGGRHLCLRAVDPATVWRHIEVDGVTHLNAAPTVLAMLCDHPAARPAARTVQVATGGAPPSPALLARLAELNIRVTHLYGLTETFGPTLICDWHREWDRLPPADQAVRKARQGVGTVVSGRPRVLDPLGAEVPADGQTMGEVAVHGNTVMLGYHDDPAATAVAAADGWLRTGDLGVRHPDGYIELRDRAKDLIVSGGENISTIEVENAIATHPAVSEVAVVGVPDEHWGERPTAYVTLRTGATATEGDIVAHVRDRLAHFKAPDRVVFGPLPKTSTGKIQKFRLREQAGTGRPGRAN